MYVNYWEKVVADYVWKSKDRVSNTWFNLGSYASAWIQIFYRLEQMHQVAEKIQKEVGIKHSRYFLYKGKAALNLWLPEGNAKFFQK